MTTRFTSRTAWRQKLEKPKRPVIGPIPPNWSGRYGSGTMLIPRPLDVDALVRRVGAGQLVTIGELRRKLAEDAGTDFTCPLTTGIFLRIVAETAEEDRREDRLPVTPYWRVVRDDGSLNDKFPGGSEAQAARLRQEGHLIEPGSGKKPPRVGGREKRLVAL